MMANNDAWTAEDEEKLRDLLRRSGRRLAGTYNPADEYTSDELDDLVMALRLLNGRHDTTGPAGDLDKHLPLKRYLAGAEEFAARKAIGRLLRNQKSFDRSLRSLLAALFDLETEEPPYSSPDMAPIERKILLKGRHRGSAMIQNRRKLEIAVAVDELIREKNFDREDALNETADRFSITTRTVEEAVAYWRMVLGR